MYILIFDFKGGAGEMAKGFRASATLSEDQSSASGGTQPSLTPAPGEPRATSSHQKYQSSFVQTHA